jgi:hypothetical protein
MRSRLLTVVANAMYEGEESVIQCGSASKAMKLPLMCESWPSARVVGSKMRFSHSNLWRLLVQPFVFAEKNHWSMTVGGIHDWRTFLPLKIP